MNDKARQKSSRCDPYAFLPAKFWTSGWQTAVAFGLLVGMVFGSGFCALAPVRAAQLQAEPHPPRAGLLVIEAAADSAAGFRWLDLPSTGARCLVWDQGILNLDADVTTGRYGVADLTLPYGPDLSGVSGGQRLLFEEGVYTVDKPLLLAAGDLQLFVTRGELVIESDRIVYRQAASTRDPRAQYMVLAGMVILITILMMRVRSRLRSR